jgi:putative superfamily III holin-X
MRHDGDVRWSEEPARARVGGPAADGLEERPIGELVGELFAEGKTLLREEVRVAKAEVRAEAKKAARAGAAFGAGGVVLHAALLLLAATLVLIGDTFMPAWLSALIVTVLFAIGGGAAIAYGRKRLAETDPSRPVKNLKEDGRWAKETMRSIRSNVHGNA